MRRLITTAIIAIALVCSFVAGAVIQGDIMPAQAASVSCSAKITSVTTTPEGKFYVNFADGTQFEFNALEDMQNFALELQTIDNAQRFLVAWWIARDDDASNTSLVAGKKLTLNLSAPSPIKVQ